MTLESGTRIGAYEIVSPRPVDGVSVTPDGSAYVYNFARRLSDLHVVEGLR